MDTLQIIKDRTSVRKYADREIQKNILEEIVDCARLAPTGYNYQGWMFIVVTDRQLRARIAEACKYGKFIREAGACIAVFCDKAAPTALEDACAATENIIISAQAQGLGTCWVNSHRKEHSEIIKEMLRCPENMELMTLIAVGYPQGGPVRKQKKTLGEVIRWETF